MFVIEPWYWLLFGVVLVISEIFVTTFASLWFGLSAIIVGMIIWVVPISWVAQVLIWLILSIVMVIAWFKYIKPLSIDRTKSGLGGKAIIGEVGMLVVKPTSNHLGKVRFSVPIIGDDEWMCRNQNDEQLDIGDRVIVTDISGNELIVTKYKKLPLN